MRRVGHKTCLLHLGFLHAGKQSVERGLDALKILVLSFDPDVLFRSVHVPDRLLKVLEVCRVERDIADDLCAGRKVVKRLKLSSDPSCPEHREEKREELERPYCRKYRNQELYHGSDLFVESRPVPKRELKRHRVLGIAPECESGDLAPSSGDTVKRSHRIIRRENKKQKNVEQNKGNELAAPEAPIDLPGDG